MASSLTHTDANALLTQANTLAQAGQLQQARAAVLQAAALQRDIGALHDMRRSLLTAAELARLAGQLDEAEAHVRAAQQGLDGSADAALVAQAQAQLGAVALLRGRSSQADQAFTQALQGHRSGAMPAWWRGRAQARAALGQAREAAQDLQEAALGSQRMGDPAAARQAALEAATLWLQAGCMGEFNTLLAEVLHSAQAEGDFNALAQAELLQGSCALQARDAKGAAAHLQQARQWALQARSPQAYMAAVVALARLAEQADEDAQAYAHLATGWATVQGLLGPEPARAAFEPALRALRQRLGEARFMAMKQAYEGRNRAAP